MNPLTRFYGGSKVKDGLIYPLQSESFPQLVSQYFEIPVHLPITRREFHKLPLSRQRQIKDVAFVTPCTFKDGETKRCDANADRLVLACLDLDPPDEDFAETDYVADFYSAPETITAALAPYNFICYTTASHTPERPRLRIIVELQPCDPSLRRKAVRHLCRLLGLPLDFKGVVESTVLSQPAYRPVHFKEEVGIPTPPAILCARTTGEALDPDLLPDEAEDEDDTPFAYDGDSATGLDYLPVYGLDTEDVREALDTLDPDCPYKQWTEIAAALRHQFRGEDEARQAYHLFDEWSSRGSKYKGEKDTRAKWRSFKPDTIGKAPVTVRSLLKKAMDAGWKHARAAAKIEQDFDQWVANCTDPRTLSEEGPRRIEAHPFSNSLVTDGMVNTLRDRLKVLGKPTDKGTIRKAIRQAKAKAQAEKGPQDKPAWLRPWVYVSGINEFVNTTNGSRLPPVNFDNNFGRELISDDPENDMAKSGVPAVRPTNYALNVLQIDRVDGVSYDPSDGGSKPYFEWKGQKYLNEYRASTVPIPDPDGAPKAGQVLRRLIEALVGKGIEADLLMDFIAFMIQFPGRKIRWGFFIQSAEGTGKSRLTAMIGAAIGPEHVLAVEPDTLKAEFNDWAYGRQFICFEEIFIQGEKRAPMMNRLKTFWANDEITLKEKYKNVRSARNFANGIAFSNHHDALYLEATNRRYLPVKSPAQTLEDVARLNNSGIFDDVNDIVAKHGGALRHFLLNYEISSKFTPDRLPLQTSYAKEMIEQSKNRLQVEIEELIESEDPLIGKDIIHAGHLNHKTAEAARNNTKPAHFLQILGFERYDQGKKFSVGSTRTTIWVHREHYDPDLTGDPVEVLRQRMEESGEYL